MKDNRYTKENMREAYKLGRSNINESINQGKYVDTFYGMIHNIDVIRPTWSNTIDLTAAINSGRVASTLFKYAFDLGYLYVLIGIIVYKVLSETTSEATEYRIQDIE